MMAGWCNMSMRHDDLPTCNRHGAVVFSSLVGLLDRRFSSEAEQPNTRDKRSWSWVDIPEAPMLYHITAVKPSHHNHAM